MTHLADTYDYDVALSFAEEDRLYVEAVATCLASHSVKVFYDAFEKNTLWANDLYQYLYDIYNKKARFCVLFLSRHYASKKWTLHECRAAQERQLFSDNEQYILPARFDDTVIPGIRSTIHYLDLKHLQPDGCAQEILRKIGMPQRGPQEQRRSWESYGQLCDVDGYRVPYIPLFNDWRSQYCEVPLGGIGLTIDSQRNYAIPDAFLASARVLPPFENCPSCRLESYRVGLAGRNSTLAIRLSETSYKDYLLCNEHLDDQYGGTADVTYRDTFGNIIIDRTGSLRLFPLSNICGVGLFILTKDKYIIASTHSAQSHVYPGRKTFCASGTMRWGLYPDPFAEILRKAEREISHLVNINNVKLVGFGADARKLYFQFAFLEIVDCTLKDIQSHFPHSCPDSLVQIPFTLDDICDSLLSHCWEPAAEATLLTLATNEFGRDELAAALARRKDGWPLREMRDEWDYRASRPGLLPEMSVRYPAECLQRESQRYVDHVISFLGDISGKGVLEVGPGTGRITSQLLQRGCTVTSVELSHRMAARLSQRLECESVPAAGLTVLIGPAQQRLPLPGFDAAVCSLVLIHNVHQSGFEALVRGMCESANAVFLFEDITAGRKTSPHTCLRSEKELRNEFRKHDFVVKSHARHQLFTDTISFLEFRRRLSHRPTKQTE